MSDAPTTPAIPLRLVTPWDSASLNVLQLAQAHMIAELRVVNRLRAERGQGPMTAQEILDLLGVSDVG